MHIYNTIEQNSREHLKMLGVLIDPDKQQGSTLKTVVEKCEQSNVDYIFVGGSIITHGTVQQTVDTIKELTKIPVILFPGDAGQVVSEADGILFLSLISGRNAEFLIGQQVMAAPVLKRTALEIIPTGYMLVDCGNTTSVTYKTGTTPIPYEKSEIAEVTALAGQYLGLKMIYLEGGSGASKPVSAEMIARVRAAVNIPLIVGGGVTSPEMADKIYASGADLIMIGNGVEKDQNLVSEIAAIKMKWNTIQKS